MNTKLKAVIFDMDGLMLDTEALAIPSIKVAGKAIGINLTDEMLIEMIGLNENDANAFLEKKLGKFIERKRFSEAFYEDYNKAIAENGLFIKEGLIELIDCLKENNIKLAVATSTRNDLALRKLKLAGIIDQFEVVIGGDQVTQGKPAPDPYLKAASELGVDVSNCLALEDSDNGAMSAFSGGKKIEEVRNNFQSDKSCCLNVYTKEDNQLIGMVNYDNFIRGAFHSCFLGFKISKQAQGKGLMTEALQFSICYVFKTLNLHRIGANYMPHSKTSLRVLKKC